MFDRVPEGSHTERNADRGHPLLIGMSSIHGWWNVPPFVDSHRWLEAPDKDLQLYLGGWFVALHSWLF